LVIKSIGPRFADSLQNNF